MDTKDPKETKGVPWADHNETESSPPDTRRDEYGDANPYQTPGEKKAEPRPGSTERESVESDAERESDV
jgi:hypothetical protein